MATGITRRPNRRANSVVGGGDSAIDPYRRLGDNGAMSELKRSGCLVGATRITIWRATFALAD